MKSKLSLSFFLIFATFIAFFYRFYGITHNQPFWVDEFSAANQARYILKYGLAVFSNPSVYFESHNITTHFLVAASFKLFGQAEWIARLPFVIIGSFIPLVVFFLSYYIFDKKTAIISTLLITFSYFEITWSRQARGYILLQFLVLITIFLYLKLFDKLGKKLSNYVLLFFTIILGVLTHSLFYILISALILHLILFNYQIFQVWLKRPWIYLAFLLLIIISYFTGFLKIFAYAYSLGALKTNNLWYYHSFLWREYGLITFLGIMGLLVGLFTKRKSVLLISLYITLHLIFLSFLFKPYVSRYLLSIFPLILIMTSYFITYFSKLFITHLKFKNSDFLYLFVPITITLFIIANGYKFIIRPKSFYSVNHDFREIALIDYNQIYDIIKQKKSLNGGEAAIIDTWWDRLHWYLGEDYQPAYAFRWKNESGFINGLSKATPFIFDGRGEKIIPYTNNVKLVYDIYDLKKVMKKYLKGFLFIDDSSLPRDVIEYAEKNLKKELYLDHYLLDDNPYSIWPATLYSWGIK